MSSISEYKYLFPIDNINKVILLFEKQLNNGNEPDLALLSIVVGAVENNLTCLRNTSEKDVNLSANKFVTFKFPSLEYDAISVLYNKFHSLVKGSVDSKLCSTNYASRELVKRVSDVIWNSLTRSYYKDRAHLQSIYSFLTGKKLDCFGVAFAVTAGCQVLGLRDVHLALSEDHAWVVFGKDSKETAEVTWHGKGNEDKRGQPIGAGVSSRSWLYVAGFPVICNRHMEVAALTSSINPSFTSTTDIHEVASMQQKLLWLLYDSGHLEAYPMALGNLGDLEEFCRCPNDTTRPDCPQLYLEAIMSARKHYANRHVYPYTYQGGYYHRHKMYKEAFDSWANAGDVIRQYNYSRDDEEIYKEFAEIANELIPQLMKAESSGHSARSILKDPQCFASLLRFYDGICKWEEGSQTPILHIGWAKPLVNTISKFDAEVRAQVNIICCDESDIPDEAQDEKSKVKEEDQTVKDEATPGEEKPSVQDEKESEIKEPDTQYDLASMVRKPESDPEISVRDQMEAVINSHPTITLYSHKMKGLKDLLLSEKLNTHAISLHLTAQSQVFINKRMRQGNEATDVPLHCSTRPKRVRRD